jgi:NAD(P)-dependent dehydrogenase (short-subunit alcohol dehydrogenase family)
MTNFEGKTAVITGGASGMGQDEAACTAFWSGNFERVFAGSLPGRADALALPAFEFSVRSAGDQD